MEAASMEERKKLEESKLTSAAAFVEGGIQDACDDACSICLEEFCDSDPSTVTGCKHEFHLQCILEWCQRSSQCPMCWQPIILKDPTSQELLDGVVQERNASHNQPRNAAIFHHPALGNFEIQHLPVGVNDAELEERIIQHLAAAAAMGRSRHFSRREGHRGRSSAQARPNFLVFSAHPNAQDGAVSLSEGEQAESPASSIDTSSLLRIGREVSPRISVPNYSAHADTLSASGTSAFSAGHASPSNSGRSPNQSSPRCQDRAGPSNLQSFSEALKSRLNAMSTRYKESISKSTRGWKERWFSRNSPMSDIGSDVRREVNVGIDTVSRMMEHMQTRDNGRPSGDTEPDVSEISQAREPVTQHGVDGVVLSGDDNRTQAPCAAHSGSD
ncbi:E3 ubiquitin-protein ligase RHF2A-like [Amaranthus tricolor]|uniref:E3 ubiquitin-protein ligase RHF2A-like n=1 Tax=Amaranthus tricolor TaxID=29722 RepID=UPI00258325BB|nr:E3 ubiquitin-protein ligase RHF2A-like [Amaranthus tricolor]XP_057534032.1 E3 ubiquitin-protein ligase RHF2A-like [Amaranthus tricolor]